MGGTKYPLMSLVIEILLNIPHHKACQLRIWVPKYRDRYRNKFKSQMLVHKVLLILHYVYSLIRYSLNANISHLLVKYNTTMQDILLGSNK